ncbi:gustatory and odorant receptor 24 isoform X2 [Toxorhynchites rutilus septentrionalis]|uniref:gustatory and odorant receptor 24 isoform X2 n=1 Tax=Toxorhynchites rutilus septentrionalis TaxID=329112 RepID=UPI002478A164|nr:gustatory and odorant receptor 24 isoform X2 [Toxorhynchites rutilus septentrionalis]
MQQQTRTVFLDVKPIDEMAQSRRSNEFQNRIGFPSSLPREAFGVESDRNIGSDVIYDTSKPIYFTLRMLGLFPFSRSSNGFFGFVLASSSMVYCMLYFVLLTTYVAYIMIERINIVRTLEGRFEEAVIAYLFIVNISPIIIIPLMWYETRKVVIILNNWTDFQVLYRKTAGRELNLMLKTKTLLLLQVIPYCILDTIIYMMGGYWYMACETISTTANELAVDFQRALRHVGPAAMVSEYRALWLRLSKLSRGTGFATCYTFTFICLYLFFIITLSIYGLMSQISNGFGIKDIGLAVTAFCSTGLLFFICDEAHHASFNVRTNFQKKLLMVELSWMNSDAQTEINMFLHATEMNPSSINLGGFFDVNRTLFKSLLATMVTYLVVLLQFQISIPDDSSVLLARNSTV